MKIKLQFLDSCYVFVKGVGFASVILFAILNSIPQHHSHRAVAEDVLNEEVYSLEDNEDLH